MMRQADETSEARLDALRREAARQGEGADGMARRAANSAPPDYYGLPALKPPVWTWEVRVYFFFGGIAGGSAAIALGARLWAGGPALERSALWVAMLAVLLCPVLLVSDLGRPGRFLYMLRVFKPRSPMSVGVWALVLFTVSTFAALVTDRWLAAGGPAGVWTVGGNWAALAVAAVTGLLLLSYTGVLLGASAIPVWSENRGLLPAQFAGSAIGSASAVLELAGLLMPALQRLGLLASGWETIVWLWIEMRRRPADLPLRRGPPARTMRIGELLSGPVALALRAYAGFHGSVIARQYAAVCFLAGALLIRYGWLAAGRASASNPQALFDLQRRSAMR